MAYSKKNILHAIWKHVCEVVAFLLPIKWFISRPQSTWAKKIYSYAEIPSIYRRYFHSMETDGQPMPVAILTPDYSELINPTSEKLFCIIGDSIRVLEKTGETYREVHFRMKEICCVEIGSLLLDAWTGLYGFSNCDGLVSVSLKYNAVTDYLFEPIHDIIRQASTKAKAEKIQKEEELQEILKELPLKFANYAKKSLLRGEVLDRIIIQTEIQAAERNKFGIKRKRKIAPAHLVMLTDREFIIIREDTLRSKSIRYGGIWEFIPLHWIRGVQVRRTEPELIEVVITLPDALRTKVMFHETFSLQVEKFVQRLSDYEPEIVVEYYP